MLVNPTRLTIDANANCQLQCPTCLTTSGKGYPMVVGDGYLKFRDLKNLLDANPQIQEVYFNNRGEMFLNPDLLSMLEYGFKKNVLMTNHSGTNLNSVRREVLEGLVKYCFRHLVCSIDGASPEVYGIYRVGGDFYRVIENIQLINHFKRLYDSEYPSLTWQFVVFGHNEHEIPIAKKMARDLNMRFIPKMSWDSNYSPIQNRDYVISETGWPAVTREEFKNIMGIHYMRAVCYDLWLTPRVNWDGKILGCCWNIMKEFGGNAFREDYISAINNEKINYARRMLMGKVKPTDDIPCTQCELYFEMTEDDNYLNSQEIFPPRTIVNRMYDLFDAHPLLYHPARFIYRTSGLKRLLGRMRN